MIGSQTENFVFLNHCSVCINYPMYAMHTWDRRYDLYFDKDIFSVLLPERFIRIAYVAPSAPGHIQVSPESRSIYSCTGQPAPESVTPSVDLRRFPANFMSKIALKNNISCINVFFKIFLDIFHNFVYAIMTKPLHLQTANCKGLHRNRSLQEVPRGYPVQ